ncbi:MAG: minor capsid protein, partial [Exiguobacterium sp.]|nr:minor capsid protein [Exiguobacterium sp.]
MDKAHQMTDKIIEGMEKRLAREYKKANSEVAKKLREYLEKFAAEDKKQRGLLEAGEITAKDYSDWRFRHIMMNKRWSDMRETLSEDLHGVNNIAQNIARGGRADVYALNHNYAVYEMEHGSGIDTGLTLYNRDAVERMIKKDPQMLPPPGKRVSKRIAEGKDIRYNNRQIQSAMTQGILQGESIPELARRLEEVTERNYTAAVRNARTMATGAQNAGRMDAYERAEENGVELVIEWVATLDDRTRHDHRILHGKRIAVGETFSTPEGELRFPGDPLGPPGEVYNCRCTTVSYVKGFEAGTVTNSPK